MRCKMEGGEKGVGNGRESGGMVEREGKRGTLRSFVD